MKISRVMCAAIVLTIILASRAPAQDKPQYVGASKCKACHLSKKKGSQYNVWKNAAHAKAYETLGTAKAKETAVKAGIKGDPQKADECLQCHVTAHGADAKLLAASYDIAEGVSCEACHGPGSLYRKTSVMNAKKYKADPEGMLAQWKELGLVIPDENTCKKCHNEKSPNYKPFNFKEFFAKIAHPNPELVKK